MRDDLLDASTSARLARARAGTDESRRLRISDLAPGQVGVLDAQVKALGPTRAYERRRGGQGLMQKVTLGDGTGEVDLVLWNEERRQAQSGPFQPGAFLRIRGASVKAGQRGGVELGLGSAVVEPLQPQASGPSVLEGLLVSLGEVRPVGAPPALHFTVDAELDTAVGRVRLSAWDGAVKALNAAVGRRIRIQGASPNPLLDGWWTVPADARID